MRRRKGQKLSLEIRKKLSIAQKKRWKKISTVERTKKIWRISKHALKLLEILGWPKDYLEHQIQIKRVSGKFQKGEVYFLYVDLAYPELKIAIEVDGSTHNYQKQKRIDRWKEKQLKNLGWSVLRFWNEEIDTNPRKVKLRIRRFMTYKSKELTTSSQITA